MSRRVRVTDEAENDIASATAWWAAHRSAEQAERWYLGIRKSIRSLADSAGICSAAPESKRLKRDVKHLLFGLSKRPSHRVIIAVNDDEVVVLRVRHVAQRFLTIADLP
jgi:plasmid stabilization system protein ParE